MRGRAIVHFVSGQFITLSSKPYFVDIIAHFKSHRKENSSEIPAHGSSKCFSPTNQIV